MIDIVFISDLHLHPERADIQQRFDFFLNFVKNGVKKVYILGDFLHVWAGDDAMDAWSKSIAEKIAELVRSGIEVFYMHGNRDFLLGPLFAKQAQWHVLYDPTVLVLDGKNILLSHGDKYCLKDSAHQYFRRLTRNPLFSYLFLKLPLTFRSKLVNKTRALSKEKSLSREEMDVVPGACVKDMISHDADILIHGHTHLQDLHAYTYDNKQLMRYVLSDWDEIPQILCYDKTKGLYFKLLVGEFVDY
jgi:UDP-2,3-diacylglucosamine hydrolase